MRALDRLRDRRPLLLQRAGRFAGTSRRTAVLMLAALLGLLLAALASTTALKVTDQDSSRGTYILLYESVVASLRGGGSYYPAAAGMLRDGGYPLRPFITFRLPTLAVIQAKLPPAVLPWLLYLVAGSTALAWAMRLSGLLRRPLGLAAGLFALWAGMFLFFQSGLLWFHEVWAGLLIALSLALRRRDQWVSAAAIAAIAVSIRELAAIYVIVMAALAWIEGSRREAIGWASVLVLLAGLVAAHAWAVAQVIGPLDPASPGWTGMNGLGFFGRAVAASTALHLVPGGLAVALVLLAVAGWVQLNDPLGLRAAAVFGAYALAIAILARVDTFYWALLVTPVLLVGLVFIPDLVRDLVTPLLDRRRVRVQRITR